MHGSKLFFSKIIFLLENLIHSIIKFILFILTAYFLLYMIDV